jgi:hypothetical protein
MQIKLTIHQSKDKFVVNTPGTHVQRQSRTYTSLDRARKRVEDVKRDHPDVGCSRSSAC